MSKQRSAPIKAVVWTGGDAPNRKAKLSFGHDAGGYFAYWKPGYCGCPDCHPIVGRGNTTDGAERDYWEQWEDKQ